eukprot:TRINITY_DN10419_c0_g1_i1.p1 TRINITY_DN10419_c0_g1~~TRINITY_DN10419_c0_g1_i1.p1  ORF type:complete len:477 (+),score=104.26 TRINITY_DN10419_c0_g1_i1:47-1477(+)
MFTVFVVLVLSEVLHHGWSLTLMESNHSIPTVIQENCQVKAAALYHQQFQVVGLNCSMAQFIQSPFSNHQQDSSSSSSYSDSGTALYYDTERFPNFPGYVEDPLPFIAQAGFDALILRSSSKDYDLTSVSFNALRFWRSRECPVPLYFILDDAISQALSKNTSVHVQMDYQENYVKTFIRSPAYIIGVSIPNYAVALTLFITSCFKLSRTGFPQVVNSATLLCILGALLAISMFITTSETQNQVSTMPWLGSQLLIIIQVVTSSSASFILSFQFHEALTKTPAKPAARGGVGLFFAFFVLHVVLFTASGLLNAVHPDGTEFGIGFVTSLTYVCFKLFISVYFFWGHWKVYKVFRTSEAGRVKSTNLAHHIGKRLGFISTVNLIGLLIALMFATPALSQHRHGWIMMVWMSTLLGLTSLLEVNAVPHADQNNRRKRSEGVQSSGVTTDSPKLSDCWPVEKSKAAAPLEVTQMVSAQI